MHRPAAALAAEGRAAWTTKRVSERCRKPTVHRDKFSFDTLPGKTTNRKLIPMNGAFSLIRMKRSESSDRESIDLKLVPGCPGSGWVGAWWLGGAAIVANG